MGIDNICVTEKQNTMTEFKYITVLDYFYGKVYTYDYDASLFGGDVETFLTTRHDLSDVHYMVHKTKPALYAKGLYYEGQED